MENVFNIHGMWDFSEILSEYFLVTISLKTHLSKLGHTIADSNEKCHCASGLT